MVLQLNFIGGHVVVRRREKLTIMAQTLAQDNDPLHSRSCVKPYKPHETFIIRRSSVTRTTQSKACLTFSPLPSPKRV